MGRTAARRRALVVAGALLASTVAVVLQTSSQQGAAATATSPDCTTTQTHTEYRYRSRAVMKPASTQEVKWIRGWQAVPSATATIRFVGVGGRSFTLPYTWVHTDTRNSTWYRVPADILNDYWGTAGVTASLLTDPKGSNNETKPMLPVADLPAGYDPNVNGLLTGKGKLDLRAYGGPAINATVFYSAWQVVQTVSGFSDWGLWTPWSSTPPAVWSTGTDGPIAEDGSDGGGTLSHDRTVAAESRVVSEPDPSCAPSTGGATPRSADVSLTKSADHGDVGPGDTVVYTLVAHNAGPAAATDTVVTDPLPEGVTYVSAPGCHLDDDIVTCAAGDLAVGASATFHVTVTVDDFTAAAGAHRHDLITRRVQADLTLAAGETRSLPVGCPAGYVATDASVLVLDNAGDIDDQLIPDAVAQDGDGYLVTVTNPTAQDNMQTRVSVMCLDTTTAAAGSAGHTHPLLLSWPVRTTAELSAGTTTVDLGCDPGQVPVAPSYTFSGAPVRVLGSAPVGSNGWAFTLEAAGAADAELAVRCLDALTGETDGHSHTLVLASHGSDVTVPAGQTATDRVECGPDGTGLVSSWTIPDGLVALGNEPQPVNRDFRLKNTTGHDLHAHLGLLCEGIRTADPAGPADIVNTAAVDSAVADPQPADNSATASLHPDPDAQAAPAPDSAPAQVRSVTMHDSAIVLAVACDDDCEGTVTVTAAGRIAGSSMRRGTVVAHGRYHHAGTLRLHLGHRARQALRHAHARLQVTTRTAGRTRTCVLTLGR